jgi:hypothetical protein
VRGLPAHLQMELDAANLAWLEELAEGGGELNELQQRRLQELRDKAAAHPSLLADAARLRAGPETNLTTGERAMAPAPAP